MGAFNNYVDRFLFCIFISWKIIYSIERIWFVLWLEVSPDVILISPPSLTYLHISTIQHQITTSFHIHFRKSFNQDLPTTQIVRYPIHHHLNWDIEQWQESSCLCSGKIMKSPEVIPKIDLGYGCYLKSRENIHCHLINILFALVLYIMDIKEN